MLAPIAKPSRAAFARSPVAFQYEVSRAANHFTNSPPWGKAFACTQAGLVHSFEDFRFEGLISASTTPHPLPKSRFRNL